MVYRNVYDIRRAEIFREGLAARLGAAKPHVEPWQASIEAAVVSGLCNFLFVQIFSVFDNERISNDFVLSGILCRVIICPVTYLCIRSRWKRHYAKMVELEEEENSERM